MYTDAYSRTCTCIQMRNVKGKIIRRAMEKVLPNGGKKYNINVVRHICTVQTYMYGANM